MATTVNATNYTKVASPDATNKVGPGVWGGRLRVQFDSYTFASTAVATTVRMAKLPKGARVAGFLVPIATVVAVPNAAQDTRKPTTLAPCGSFAIRTVVATAVEAKV